MNEHDHTELEAVRDPVNRALDISGTIECGRGPFGEQFYCLEGSKLAELRHRGTSGFVVGGGRSGQIHEGLA